MADNALVTKSEQINWVTLVAKGLQFVRLEFEFKIEIRISAFIESFSQTRTLSFVNKHEDPASIKSLVTRVWCPM